MSIGWSANIIYNNEQRTWVCISYRYQHHTPCWLSGRGTSPLHTFRQPYVDYTGSLSIFYYLDRVQKQMSRLEKNDLNPTFWRAPTISLAVGFIDITVALGTVVAWSRMRTWIVSNLSGQPTCCPKVGNS